MRYFTTLFLFVICTVLLCSGLHAQPATRNYEKEWKKVDDLVRQRLPKSALVEVRKIYTMAKAAKQEAQVIKSLVYIYSLQDENREDNELFSVLELEKEIQLSSGATKSILQSLLASIYWSYFETARWRLYNRTQTDVTFKKEDIQTWTVEDFHRRMTELHLAAISNEKLLQQTSLASYGAIIMKGNVRHLRPTLYDLLAHRALDYFKNDERNIRKPAYAFEINQASAFDPAADFITRKFVTADSLSLQHKALLIYQKLIAFHLRDAKPDALIDVDLDRIVFVRFKSVHPEKDQLYFNAVNHIAQQYGNLPAASQAWYLVAAYHEEKANSYQPYGDTTHRFDRIKAKTILERLVQQKDSSEGKVNAQNLLHGINQKTLLFHIEKVNLPGQPFRSLVEYKNFTTLHLRIIRINDELKKKIENQHDEKYWPAILAAKAERNWQQSLPDTRDMQQHKVEIKIDALPVGEYMLIAAADKNFENKTAVIGARLFYVSSISYVNHSRNFFVLNRETGQPIPNASVTIWERKYDYKKGIYVTEKYTSYTTDKNGAFTNKMPDEKLRNGVMFQLDISTGSDRLFLNDHHNDYYYDRNPNPGFQKRKTVFLFADRSLYRPGQTVYFKGIVIDRNEAGRTNKIVTNYSSKVYLRDVNGQDVDSLVVSSNEYGSFNGKFQLPAGVLNGNFSIYLKNDDGNVDFRMEEYKRPKFYVEYEPIKGTYQVNDKIKITGIAKAYAGNVVDGAMVNYRVTRKPRMLYPWLIRGGWPIRGSEQEIAHGTAKTDKDGKFIIEFTAIPDLTIDKKSDPAFDYNVHADVTDINGETRSAEKMVTVSYKSVIIDATVPTTIAVDSLKSLLIRTENTNGEFQPATVQVTISKLKPENRLIRPRYWDRPDQFVMSKQEYIRHFPHDEYNNETDRASAEKDKQVYQKSDSARVSGEWKIENTTFEPGLYMVEITTTDKNGQPVKDIRYIELIDEKNRRLSFPRYLSVLGSKPTEPGQTASAKLGTAADNVHVIQLLDRDLNPADGPSNLQYSNLNLNDERKQVDFPITEADRGGFGVSWVFVKHNRVFAHNETIQVPWTNKQLRIEYASYRDKTLPGSEERWKLKIIGPKQEKVAAELLASMYDASLDQFYPHSWSSPGIWNNYVNMFQWQQNDNFSKLESVQRYYHGEQRKYVNKVYDGLITNSSGETRFIGIERVLMGRAAGVVREQMAAPSAVDADDMAPFRGNKFDGLYAKQANAESSQQDSMEGAGQDNKPIQSSDVQVRKNFNETAFFFPELRTDKDGNIEFSFTIPEALTRWKFMAISHTQDLALAQSSTEIVTQKQLMVQPNAPRFLREGDKMELSTKIVNLTAKELTGQAELQLIDATTNQPVDGWFKNMMPNQYFTVAAGASESVKFPIEVPYLFNKALVWRIVAKAENFSDGEENALPVLTNRMLVTESLPLNVRGGGTKTFVFDKLSGSANSETLQHHALTLEYTSNPAWYAVQALPYLMEFPYECAEQNWNRYYANSLATHVANSSPRIREVFDKWRITDTAALMSNLQKNQELKSVLLEETPWVLQAKNEAEQKKNIALLFDLVRMNRELNGNFEKLKKMQSSNGGFVWFTGGPDDRYITQYIVTGIGHLKKLGAFADDGQQAKLRQILETAIPYLDRKIQEDYAELKKNKTDLKKYVPWYISIQYLYMRSFFPEYKILPSALPAYNYYKERIAATWTQMNKYMQGMTALALHRSGDLKTPVAILKSLKETAINHDELGMYWKDAGPSWWWYEAPIERQALLIETFQEISKDMETVDDLRTWLLKNKQTNNWKTTKATAEACYALLLQGTQWLTQEPVIEVRMGNNVFSSTDNKTEAGTGYFKKVVDGKSVNPSMGNISVTVKPANGQSSSGTTWGSVYWQYFEDLDKITTAATPLKLVKKLFIEKNTDRGPVLTPVNDGALLKVGDKIKVRVELRVDRDMEYVHMKDMRASALEPVNVLSGYKYQGGLGYYETTKDASTNFFFNYLRRGTYVFEYPLFVTHAGDFSNGITTIQCMYAPEFSAHSEGVRVRVE